MNIRNIFAANIIFIRSTKTATIKDYDEVRRRCWKVHEYFLSVVQPKVILCLGCDENKSAFSELKKNYAPEEKIFYFNGCDFRSGKYFVPKRGDGGPSIVVGLPHPSYRIFTFWSHLDEFKDALNRKLEELRR